MKEVLKVTFMVATMLLVATTLPCFAGDFKINAGGATLCTFTDTGNLVLGSGWVVENARLHQWTSELSPRDDVKEFIVRSGSTVVAVLDERRGNIYLRGGLEEEVVNLQASALDELRINNSYGTLQAVITENGDLRIRGTVTDATADEDRQALEDQYDTYNYHYFDDFYQGYGDARCARFVDDNSYLPGNLSFDDLKCNHGGLQPTHGDWQWNETVSKMFAAVEVEYGSTITVTCAFRCPRKNNYQGSNSLSKHAYGRAFDYDEGTTQANWDVALDAATAGVDPDRILLYPYEGGQWIKLQDFIDNGWNPSNLPPDWNEISLGHCDSGQPSSPNQETR